MSATQSATAKAEEQWKNNPNAQEATDIKGVGFVQFGEQDQDTFVEGTLHDIWPSQKFEHNVATVVWKDGNAPVKDANKHTLEPTPGTAVYIGLGPVMLARAFEKLEKGDDFLLLYKGVRKTKNDKTMKEFSLHFEHCHDGTETPEDMADKPEVLEDETSDDLPF